MNVKGIVTIYLKEPFVVCITVGAKHLLCLAWIHSHIEQQMLRPHWVALCVENGLVGPGNTKESAIEKLKEAIDSFGDVYKEESEVYTAPLSIKELHEFLTIE